MIRSKLTLTAILFSALLMGITGLTSCASTNTQESTGQYIDSSVTTTKIKSKLLADKKVKSLPITVKTYKNTVQLSGFVNNIYQKNRALAIASEVVGRENVQDSLVIKSPK